MVVAIEEITCFSFLFRALCQSVWSCFWTSPSQIRGQDMCLYRLGDSLSLEPSITSEIYSFIFSKMLLQTRLSTCFAVRYPHPPTTPMSCRSHAALPRKLLWSSTVPPPWLHLRTVLRLEVRKLPILEETWPPMTYTSPHRMIVLLGFVSVPAQWHQCDPHQSRWGWPKRFCRVAVPQETKGIPTLRRGFFHSWSDRNSWLPSASNRSFSHRP